MLTLSQIKTAYQGAISGGTIGVTFAIRDYLLYLIYENTYNPTPSGGTSEETLTSATWANDTVNTTVAAGAFCVTFETSEDFTGTINGISRRGSQAYTFRANYNHTLPEIVTVVTTGTINVDIQL